MVVKDAQDYYDKYQQADQFARLSLKPEQSVGLQDLKWAGVDRRGASLLIAATPEDVKKEIIASLPLMVLYRPGSAVEKGQMLKKTENPEPANTSQEAVVETGTGEDAQMLMKAFMEQKSAPNIKVLRVENTQVAHIKASPALRELMKFEEDLVSMCRMGLLDSGATHALRPRTPQDKGEKTSVSITLAGEQKVQMDQTKSGTILGDKQTQPIVPLGTLVQALGYEFAWDRKGCRLKHPDKKEIKVYTRSNCPEIMQCDALRLIAELEEAKLSEAMGSLATLRSAIMAAKDYTQWSWKDAIKEYVATGDKELSEDRYEKGRGVRSPRGKEVLEAVQDLHIRIRTLGFRVKPLRRWCRESDIYQTYTEGLAPAQNATAESHVKWLKGKARLHLQDAELDKELWPCAMKHACKLRNARELGEKAPEIKFGAVVWVKSKKDRGPFDPRWERGIYMGPADDVREGHVVRLDDGLWMRTLHMRTVRDDEVEDEDDEEFVVDLVEPTRRLRRKTKLADPEVRALDARSRKALVEKLLASSIWESPEAKIERPQMREGEVWDGAAYVAGDEIAEDGSPGKVFTSVALVKNATMPLHRDAFNPKSTVNLVSPLKVSKGSCVWQEMKPGDEFHAKYHSMWFKEKEIPGQPVSSSSTSSRRVLQGFPELSGERMDTTVLPGGRVELRLRWAIRYCPEGSQENVVMTSTPLLPLGHDEEEHLRRRVTWLSDLVEEERQVRRAREARGEYASQRERQMFYKLDEAIN
ncbi:unnamed protein product [Symbiodinium sp. CCMP2592]|nr:unnamed protein product [Symbiodinium sp. CCMP2592]